MSGSSSSLSCSKSMFLGFRSREGNQVSATSDVPVFNFNWQRIPSPGIIWMRFKLARQHACLCGGVLEPREAQADWDRSYRYLKGWMEHVCKAEGKGICAAFCASPACMPMRKAVGTYIGVPFSVMSRPRDLEHRSGNSAEASHLLALLLCFPQHPPTALDRRHDCSCGLFVGQTCLRREKCLSCLASRNCLNLKPAISACSNTWISLW